MKERVKKSILLISVAMLLNIALAIIKLHVGLSSNSLCIMVDATNSFFDVATCVITLIVFLFLLKKRDDGAPFGYGRGEYLAGFIVAVVAIVVGGEFFMRSINRMAMPEPVWFGWQNCVLISIGVPLKLGIGLAYYFANKSIKSKAIKAIMLDSFLDTGVTATSLISFTVSSEVDYAVDALFGIVISIVIIIVALKTLVENVKAIVVGDGCEEERAVVKSVCEQRGIEPSKIVLHDYGYAMKTGVVSVPCDDGAVLEEMGATVKETTGAEVIFISQKCEQVDCDSQEK